MLVSFFSYSLLVFTVLSGTAVGGLLSRLAPEEVSFVRRWLAIKKKMFTPLPLIHLLFGFFFFLAAPHQSFLFVLSVILFLFNLLVGIGNNRAFFSALPFLAAFPLYLLHVL